MRIIIWGLWVACLAGCGSIGAEPEVVKNAYGVAAQLHVQCAQQQEQLIAQKDTDPVSWQRVQRCWTEAEQLSYRADSMRAGYEQRRANAFQQLGAGLSDFGAGLQRGANAYGNAANAIAISPPPAPPQPSPVGALDDLYTPHIPPHGCVGQVPVSGPGSNPCP